MTTRRIGFLTSGGDAPGMNAALAGVADGCERVGATLVPIAAGFDGLARGVTTALGPGDAEATMHQAGSRLGTSRWSELRTADGVRTIVGSVARLRLDVLVVAGGAGSLAGVAALHAAGVPVIGIPATIDGDVAGHETTMGFESAVAYAVRVVDDLRASARSLPHRAFLVETLGGDSGNLARACAEASGLELVVTPEDPGSLEHAVARLGPLVDRGYAIVVAGEGAGPGHVVADELSRRTNTRVRLTVLGHGQRAATPTVRDRLLGLRSGRLASRAAPGHVCHQRLDGSVDLEPLAP